MFTPISFLLTSILPLLSFFIPTLDKLSPSVYGFRPTETSTLSTSIFSFFDDVLSVEDVKMYKPHSDVYKMPLKKYHIEKNQFAYLSANTWDVSAAGNFGFNAVWVNRNKNIFDNLDYKPTTEINNLNDLNNLI